MDFGTSSLLPQGSNWVIRWYWTRDKQKFSRLFRPSWAMLAHPKLSPGEIGKQLAEELKGELGCLNSSSSHS